METVSAGWAQRKSRGADHSGHLRSAVCLDRRTAFLWRGRKRGSGVSALGSRFQIMVRQARTGASARTRVPHVRDVEQGGRQGSCGAHDRPPRNLSEWRSLTNRILFFLFVLSNFEGCSLGGVAALKLF